MALNDAPLGKSSDYPDAYDPQLLFPWHGRKTVAASAWRMAAGPGSGRLVAGLGNFLVAHRGVPAVAWAEIRVPSASPSIIESKSLKLYLNS